MINDEILEKWNNEYYYAELIEAFDDVNGNLNIHFNDYEFDSTNFERDIEDIVDEIKEMGFECKVKFANQKYFINDFGDKEYWYYCDIIVTKGG